MRQSDDPLARERWFMHGRTVEHGSAAEYRLRAYEQKVRMRALNRMQFKSAGSGLTPQSVLPSPAWTNLGPAPLNSDYQGNQFQYYGMVSGRVTAVTVDQNDSFGNTVYVGAAYGGVWKTTNGTATAGSVNWTPIIDDQATLAVGAISVQPGNSSNILVGTGEPNAAIDSYYGMGVLRSTDGGLHWILNGYTQDGTKIGPSLSSRGLAVSKFAWASPDNNNLVVAGLSAADSAGSDQNGLVGGLNLGLIYSTDAGATWNKATFSGMTANRVTDVVYNPAAHKFYAVMRSNGVISSSDGVTWTKLTTQPGSNTSTLYRGHLAVVPGRNEMYIWYVDGNLNEGGIYQSLDGGTTWNTISTNDLDNCNVNGISGEACGIYQVFYNLYIAAIPNGNGTDLYAGSGNIFKCQLSSANPACSSNAPGFNWLNLTHIYSCSPLSVNAHVHPDQHGIDFLHANPSIIYFGNDGGIYRTLNGPGLDNGTCTGTANPFDNLNGTLGSTIQFYSLAGHPTDPTSFVGGTQDNGAPGVDSAHAGSNGLTWTEVQGGDGASVAIDRTNGNNWYVSRTGNVYIYFSSSGVTSRSAQFSYIISPSTVGGDYGSWVTPFILDPADQTRIIIGTCRVWRGPSSGVGWTSGNVLTNNLGANTSATCGNDNLSSLSQIRTLAAGGPKTSNGSQVIYAGSQYGHIFSTINTDGGPSSWIDIVINSVGNCWNGTSYGYPCGQPISGVAIDPSDSTGRTAYATVMGFGIGHVYKTTNGGATWTNITGNLVDAPADAVAVDPINPAIVYVGTDFGVFATQDGGATWTEYGTGFPNTEVVALDIFNSGSTHLLRAATHGRGAWSTTLAGASVPVSPPYIAQAFATTTILLNGTTSLTFTITNPNGAVSLSGVSFNDALPSGLVVATPNGVTGSCGSATITANAGSSSITLSGGTIAAGGSCQFSVSVAGTSPGPKTNSVTVSSTNAGSGNTANATLTVASTTQAGCELVILGGLALHDKTANTPFADPTPLTPGHAVDGIATSWSVDSNGLLINSTGTSEPVADLLIFDATGTAGCFRAGNTIVITYNGVATSPSVPGTLSVPGNLDIYDSSGIGGLTITSATLSLVFANNTSNTQIVISVGAAGTAGGVPIFPSSASQGGTSGSAIRIKNLRFNASSLAASTFSVTAFGRGGINAGTLSPQSTVATKVAGLVRPTISTNFGSGSISLNGTTSLTFTLSNNNTSTTLNAVQFWDTLPSGLVVAAAPGLTNSCSGSTVNAVAGSNSVFMSTGVTLTAGASCTVSVNITGTTAGVKNNGVPVLSSTTGWGNTASASLTVIGPPVITKSFGAGTIDLNGTTTLSFTIQNNNTATTLTGIGFADTFPSGLVVANPNGLSGSCGGGTITATAGAGSVSLSGASLALSTSCTFTLNVSGTSAGAKTNSVTVNSANGGTGNTSNASLTVGKKRRGQVTSN